MTTLTELGNDFSVEKGLQLGRSGWLPFDWPKGRKGFPRGSRSGFPVSAEKQEAYAEQEMHSDPQNIRATFTQYRLAWQPIPVAYYEMIQQVFEWLQSQGVCIGLPAEVRNYLQRFPDMLEVIVESVALARRNLPTAQLELTVYRDPENEDEHLILYARFAQYDPTVMEKIRSVRRQYRRVLLDKSGWFILTTDFQKPGWSGNGI